jgi:D-alanyl-D-alanine carboxypeptidase/D-alanyl-D-alanine-endopeptidase (penicillin-binding protein 4)
MMTEKAAHDSLAMELEALKNDHCFKEASLGYIIEDFSKGMPAVLFEFHSKDPLIPASTQKILTTGAALEILGEAVSREVTLTNLESINWRANRLLQKIGQKNLGRYDFVHGSVAVMEFWKKKGINMTGLYICDGSGKSRDNRVSPKQLADVLFSMTTSVHFPVFYNSLPLSGISGTLHKMTRGTPAEGRIRAKTGSIAGVRSYTGYVRTFSGKKLIFTRISGISLAAGAELFSCSCRNHPCVPSNVFPSSGPR